MGSLFGRFFWAVCFGGLIGQVCVGDLFGRFVWAVFLDGLVGWFRWVIGMGGWDDGLGSVIWFGFCGVLL